MSVIGIVCEYNPFHNGHAWHIRKSRKAVPDSPVICVMSGDFVQRGEGAMYSKYARAKAACACGADLVVELPLPWSLSSAESFARGAVGMLHRLGATHLCFGSETGDLEELEELTQILVQPDLNDRVKVLLDQDGSLSYAAAREKVALELLGRDSEALRQSNNILAVEYLKAIHELNLDLQPVAIHRRGTRHDQDGQEGYRSASQIRRLILSGRDPSMEFPAKAWEVFSRERESGRERSDRASIETAMLSRLRMLDEDSFLRLPDAANGLGKRLYRAVQTELDYDGILAATKTKRYAMSRIRRMCMCACLGVEEGMSRGLPPYARILAFNERGQELIRQSSALGRIPMITKPAAIHSLSPSSQEIFRLGSKAHDLYVLGYRSRNEQRPGMDWRTGPAILMEETKAD